MNKIMILLCALLLPCTAQAATFTVTNTADGGAGSLRVALANANNTTAADTITFAIGNGAKTITLASALPPITHSVTIDATTQPGYTGSTPLIEINGSNAGSGASGLTVAANNVVIKGLAINRFDLHGILISGGSGTTVTQCFIGTDVTGNAALANGHTGVFMANTGGHTIGPGNLISGNAVDGVRFDAAGATGTVVKGNKIGTNAAGNAALGNSFNGIVFTNAAHGNTIGGTTAADTNVVAANTKNGIAIGSGATANVVERNYVGLAADGATALGNGQDGVLIQDAPANKIGGDVAGTFNIVSGNGKYGIEIITTSANGANADGNLIQRNIIGSDLFGMLDRGNAFDGINISADTSTSSVISSTVIGAGAWGAGGNLISGNAGSGIELSRAAQTLVQGNRIGTDISGSSVIANGGDGIRDDSGYITNIGGVAAPNLISGNVGAGIDIVGDNQAMIVGNRIGTDANGSMAVPNARGIWVRNAYAGAVIGGADHDPWTCNRACNLISGNTVAGIQLGTSSADSFYVRGNFVGVNLAGNAALPNGGPGVVASSGWGTQLGGEAAGEGNLISGNAGAGLEAPSAGFLSIYGNRIGSNATGTTAIGNGTGGIYLHGTKPNLTLGSSNHTSGACDGGCNLIAGNGGDGLRVALNDPFTSSSKNIVGNYFGTAADGSSCLGNSRDGLRLESGFDFGLIGGVGAQDGNRIACNGGNGITQFSGNDIASNGFLGNVFFANGLLAIDNGNDGVTPNDPGDGDVWLENFPLLDAAITAGSTTTLRGRLAGAASQNYRVEFFASPGCDASGYGEGQNLVGSLNIATDGNGDASFTQSLGAVVALGQSLTATATVVSGTAPFIDYSTSEFSACVSVRPPAPSASNGGPVCQGQTLNLAATAVAGASYAWSGPNGFTSSAQNPSIAGATAAASGSYSVVAKVAGVSSDPATTNAIVNACALSIADASVTEGNSGTTPANFTVTLDHASTQAVTVQWASADGTATAPADYASASGTLTFNANETSKVIAINIAGDTLAEGNETFKVNLSNASGAAISRAQATGTIIDDDVAGTVQLSASTYAVTEAGGSATITVTRSGGSASGVSVHYGTADGTATAGSDYTATSGTLTFVAGETSKTFGVPITNDTLSEGSETIALSLSSPAGGATLGTPNTATLTITDDDPAGTIQFSAGTYSVSESSGSATITVTRSAGTASGVSVHYASSNGSAISGSDYTATSGTLNFAAGETSKTFSVPILNDSIAEAAETLTLTLSSAAGGATLGTPASATLTISDDDAANGEFDMGECAAEISETVAQIQLDVQRLNGSNGAVSVHYATSDGTARAGADYVATSGTLNWAAGDSALKTITVALIRNPAVEPTEQFEVDLSAPGGGAVIGAANLTTVIVLDYPDSLFRDHFDLGPPCAK